MRRRCEAELEDLAAWLGLGGVDLGSRVTVGQAIGQMLPAAIGVAISPLPIVAVVLMLATPRGRTNGPAFIVGWWVGLAVVGAIVLQRPGGAASHETAVRRHG